MLTTIESPNLNDGLVPADAVVMPIEALACRKPPCDMNPTCDQEGICLAPRSPIFTEQSVGSACVGSAPVELVNA